MAKKPLQDNTGSIDWASLSQDEFEQLVEMLLFLENKDKPGVDVILPDGRGGDDGVDVGLMSAEKYLHIYQLKYFPEGFKNFRASTRKRQIQKSFQKAINDRGSLAHWTLVMPAKFTQGELAYVRSLAQGHGVRVHTLGPREMDALLANHPQLIEQTNRAPILEALATLRAEDAALTTPGDLPRRIAKIGSQADAVSNNWGKNFRYENGQVIEELIAKHPRAHELEPLSIRFSMDLESTTPAVRRAFAKYRDYGSERRVQIPVSAFEQVGPEWFAEKTEGGELIVERIPLPPADQLPFTIHVLDDDGFTVSAHTGQLTEKGRGRLGIALEASFYGAVDLTLEVPYERASPGSLNYTSEFRSHPISMVSNGRSLLRALESQSRIRIQVGESELFEMAATDGAGSPSFDPEFHELVDDLAVIWRETGVDFRFPTSLTNYERVTIRICRMLYSGKTALLHPGASIPINLNDDAELPTEPVQAFATIPRQPMEVLGHRIDVGPVFIYCPSTQWTSDSQSFSKQRTARVTPTKGYGIRVLKENGPKRRIEPEPWNLPQIPEHPELAQE